MRPSGRAPDEMRAITIETGFTKHAEGSCLIGFGETRVLVTASVEEKIPPWLRGKGSGWWGRWVAWSANSFRTPP